MVKHRDASPTNCGNENPEQRPLRPADRVRNACDHLEGISGFESAQWFKRHGIGSRDFAELSSLDLLHRAKSLLGAIDEEFAGEPFLPDGAPESKENQNRFKTYMAYYMHAATLLKAAVQIAIVLDEPPVKPTGVRKSNGSGDSSRAGNFSSEGNSNPAPTSEEKERVRPERGPRAKR
jgi:hypothetical protein